MKKDSQLKENREKLKALSNALKPLVKEGIYATINEAIADTYSKQGHKTLKKFWDWKRDGQTIAKGEHALLLWGQPRKGKNAKPQDNEKDEFSFFPVCYVFSNMQIVSK